MPDILQFQSSPLESKKPTVYIVKGNDFESAIHEFDPFKARKLDHPISNKETLTHLLTGALGTGILSMPAAFKASGLVVGIFSSLFVSIICAHCSYILVESAHELYKKSGKTQMSFAEVAEESCKRGPKWARKFAVPAKHTVQIGLFVAYFFICSCYVVIIAKNINYVLDHYLGYEVNIRITMLTILIPLILLAYVPNLKYLATCSMIANICMAIGIGITFYYLVADIPPITDRRFAGEISTLPVSISIVLYAIEAIGVIMPLENHMETPQHFTGLFGILNQGMAAITVVFILLGFFGFLKYGELTEGSITYNLPKEAYVAQAVNILIAIAVFFTIGLHFYVCIDIAWNAAKDKCTKHPIVSQYAVRTVMVTICVAAAIAVPTIMPFVGLVGAFCFTILGIILPVGIEIITFWDKGFGTCNWKIFKNIVVVITGTLALIFGSKAAIEDIVELYK